MPVYSHHVLAVPPRSSDDVGRRLLTEGAPRINTAGGRLVGVFKPEAGLSRDHVVALAEWPDEPAATANAASLLAGIDGLTVERDEVWTPTLRPEPGATIEPVEGVFTHRWFDVADGDDDRFLELSAVGWSNWETSADNYVVGLWRSHTPTAPGITRYWLMSWYRNLDAWERSRFWSASARPELAEGNDRFRERNEIVVDRAVSMLWRIV